MEGKLTPLGVFLKWVFVPVIVAAIGYLIVGPSLGKDILKRVPGLHKPSGPSVEVDVKPRA